MAAAARLGYRCGRSVNGRGAATAARVVAQRRPPNVLVQRITTAAALVEDVRHAVSLLMS